MFGGGICDSWISPNFKNKQFLIQLNQVTANEMKYRKRAIITRALYIFSYNSNHNYEKVPKIFGIIYSLYSSQNLSLSKIIKKDFKTSQKLLFSDNAFKSFLRKKIKFINTAYLDLNKIGFKKGMYRFSWYLNN